MDFMDTPEQGHSFIDDEVDSAQGVQTVQNTDPLKAQAAMLALTQKSVTQAQDSYLNLMNSNSPVLDNVNKA